MLFRSGRVADLHAWHIGIYYSVFLASIVWAFVRGAARGSIELLGLATCATAAIPLASVLGWLAPSSGLWGSTTADTIGIDIGAAIGALCFAWMWRKTTQRVASGRTDSVWSRRRVTRGNEPVTRANDTCPRLDQPSHQSEFAGATNAPTRKQTDE